MSFQPGTHRCARRAIHPESRRKGRGSSEFEILPDFALCVFSFGCS